MPAISHQFSLFGAILILALAIAGILSQSRRIQEKRNGVIVAISWGTLLFSVLMILSNDTFSQFILGELTRIGGR